MSDKKISALQTITPLSENRSAPHLLELSDAHRLSELPMPAEALEKLFPPVRDAVALLPEIEPIDKDGVLPEQTMTLRDILPSHWQGTLTYSAKLMQDNSAEVIIKIALPPDSEETFVLKVEPESLNFSISNLFELFRKTIVEQYVFKNLDKKDKNHGKRKGLTGDVDLAHIRHMARDVFEAFRIPIEEAGVGIA